MSTEAVQTKHPLYIENKPDWDIIRDCDKGERAIKEKGTAYLPATSGMHEKGMGTNQPGLEMYKAYLQRAVFPKFIRPAVNALVGVMHREAAIIELPAAMEPLRENATLEGESLLALLRRINEAQVLVGLMADVPTGDSTSIPYIATYEAEAIINWDESRRPDGRNRVDLVVLDESDWERTSSFGWERVAKYLVLDLVNPGEEQTKASTEDPPVVEETSVYRSRLVIDDQGKQEREQANRDTEVTTATTEAVEGVLPSFRGQTLSELPLSLSGPSISVRSLIRFRCWGWLSSPSRSIAAKRIIGTPFSCKGKIPSSCPVIRKGKIPMAKID